MTLNYFHKFQGKGKFLFKDRQPDERWTCSCPNHQTKIVGMHMGVYSKWSRTFIEFSEFREFRGSEKSLRHELGSV